MVPMLEKTRQFQQSPTHLDYNKQVIHEIREMQIMNMGNYAHGNQPIQHMIYLYNYAGQAWKTQKCIRKLLNEWFRNDLMGVPGDEDGGGMSSFVVFSQMGFYPVTPGLPWYTVGSPVFEEININLENGKVFTVIADGASELNKYIQSASLNGQEMDTPWFSHADLMGGATLQLVMGPKPNKELWKNADSSYLYR